MQEAEQSSIDYKALYEEQLAVREALQQRLVEQQKHYEQQVGTLSWEVAQLRRLIYGARHERFVPAPDATAKMIQAALGLDAETVAHCKITSATTIEYIRTKVEVTPAKPKAHPGRMKLPEHLRRETILLKPEGDVSGLQKMGEEVTEILDYVPAELYVKQYIRPKYVLPIAEGGSTVLTASLPGRMMEKCMAGEGLLAQMVVDKYMDHIPIHRQLQRYGRLGVTIAQSTSNDWMRTALNQLHSLYEVHKRITLATAYLGADETPIKVLDEDKKGSTHRGYYWVYHNPEQKLVLFDYRSGRGREGPDDILKDFQGYLQTDGYSVYDDFDRRPGITLLHCMAHARRKFHEALQNDQPRAEYALGLFQQLYAIERRIKEEELADTAIVAIRQQEAVPVLQTLKTWMETEYPAIVVKKSPVAQAMAYFLPRWEKLSVYTKDARLNIDNNLVENAIRPVAVGRKNYLFAGSHDAAQRAAMVYSLLATCKLHHIDPYYWLRDVFEHMHLFDTSNIEELLPQNWAKLNKA
ncbi:MAG: IS66 family transposase [Chitinophagaceae bacterium]|nr:MAG: IS66 family transposase [Chitinophagaceae bacterium]